MLNRRRGKTRARLGRCQDAKSLTFVAPRRFEFGDPCGISPMAAENPPPEPASQFVDDHSRLSSHMNESSWIMGGGRMSVELDDAKGQAVGSHIRLSGRVLGVPLYLDEVVTRRDAPREKVWETVGAPQLLVIGDYAMGVHVSPSRNGSRLRVFIHYAFSAGWVTYWLGRLFGGVYARWCVAQMLTGASNHFGSRIVAAA